MCVVSRIGSLSVMWVIMQVRQQHSNVGGVKPKTNKNKACSCFCEVALFIFLFQPDMFYFLLPVGAEHLCEGRRLCSRLKVHFLVRIETRMIVATYRLVRFVLTRNKLKQFGDAVFSRL